MKLDDNRAGQETEKLAANLVENVERSFLGSKLVDPPLLKPERHDLGPTDPSSLREVKFEIAPMTRSR